MLWQKPAFGKVQENMSGKIQCNKGGARHFTKPYIDPDIVFSIVSKNQDILCRMEPYEVVSRNNAPDPKRILHCSMLVMDFLDASESGEVHQSSLKKGLNTLWCNSQMSTPPNTQEMFGLTFGLKD